jgi:hypothetical protein
MEAVGTSATSVSYHYTTRRHNTEKLDLNLHRCESLKYLDFQLLQENPVLWSGHFTSDSQSVCPSWSRAPNCDAWPYFSLEENFGIVFRGSSTFTGGRVTVCVCVVCVFILTCGCLLLLILLCTRVYVEPWQLSRYSAGLRASRSGF